MRWVFWRLPKVDVYAAVDRRKDAKPQWKMAKEPGTVEVLMGRLYVSISLANQ